MILIRLQQHVRVRRSRSPSPSLCLTRVTGAVAVSAPSRRPPAEGPCRGPVGTAARGACRDDGGGLILREHGATAAPAEHDNNIKRPKTKPSDLNPKEEGPNTNFNLTFSMERRRTSKMFARDRERRTIAQRSYLYVYVLVDVDCTYEMLMYFKNPGKMEIANFARGPSGVNRQREHRRRLLGATARYCYESVGVVAAGDCAGGSPGQFDLSPNARTLARLCSSWSRKTRAVLSKIKFKQKLRTSIRKRAPPTTGAQSAACLRPTTPSGHDKEARCALTWLGCPCKDPQGVEARGAMPVDCRALAS